MTVPPIHLVTGQPTAIPLQCYVRGSGTVPAIFNASDVLQAEVIQSKQTGALFTPAIAWYTADNTQVGYTQGQVEATLTTDNAVLLIPTISYTLLVWRALSSAPTIFELVARVPLVIEPLAV